MVVRSSFFLRIVRSSSRRGGATRPTISERSRAPPLPSFLSLARARGRIDRDDLLSCVVVVVVLLLLLLLCLLLNRRC